MFQGKAQKAYSTLSVADSQVYAKVKEVVLKAYELVPEAHRQKIRALCKGAQQSFSELARDLRIQFDRWCSSSHADTYEALYELMLLEQFKNTLSEEVAVFITERNIKTAEEASFLADEYVRTHKGEVSKNRCHHTENG